MSDGNSIDATPRDLWWFRKNVPCLDACPVKTDAGRYVQLIARRTPGGSVSRRALAQSDRLDMRARLRRSMRGRMPPRQDRRARDDSRTQAFSHRAIRSRSALVEGSARDDRGTVGRRQHNSRSYRPSRRAACRRRVEAQGRGRRRGAGRTRVRKRSGADGLQRDGVRSDAEHAGGMLRYGIPAYRLPRDVIDCQVREIEELGVEFRYSTPFRPGFGVRELKAAGLRSHLSRRRRVARPRSADRGQRCRRRDQGDRLPAQYKSRLPRSARRQSRRDRRRPRRDRCGANRRARARARTGHVRGGRAERRGRHDARGARCGARSGAARCARSHGREPRVRAPRCPR